MTKGNVVNVPPRLIGDGEADRSPLELPWALLGLVLGDSKTDGVDDRDPEGVGEAAVVEGVGEAGAGVPVGDGESVGAATEVVEGEGEAPATKVTKGRTVKSLRLGEATTNWAEPLGDELGLVVRVGDTVAKPIDASAPVPGVGVGVATVGVDRPVGDVAPAGTDDVGVVEAVGEGVGEVDPCRGRRQGRRGRGCRGRGAGAGAGQHLDRDEGLRGEEVDPRGGSGGLYRAAGRRARLSWTASWWRWARACASWWAWSKA